MKLSGTIRTSDIEGGHWLLETATGERYQLTGTLEGARDGIKVEVTGRIDRTQMGFGMQGAMFTVTKLTHK